MKALREPSNVRQNLDLKLGESRCEVNWKRAGN